MIKETSSRLLAYSKEFFDGGERELEQNTNMAYMQAVLKLHDAVEYCVRAIIEEFNVNHDRNLDLMPLMKCINKNITSKTLPFASQIDFLNTTRGKIKHHASVPSLEDVQRCRLYAKDFLDQVTQNYFGMNFFSISRVLLIEDINIRKYLESAETKIKESDYLEALILVKKAFYCARPSNHIFISDDPFFSKFFLTSYLHDIPELEAPIEKIVNKVKEIEENVALLMMGIDVLKLERFEEITPHFDFYFNGECSIIWNDSIIPTIEIVEEAINYVIDMTLLWQRKGVVGSRPEWKQLHTKSSNQSHEVRREKWYHTK